MSGAGNGLLSVNSADIFDSGVMRSADAGSADTKSRRDKAFAAIEGHEVGFFEGNPWNPIFGFDASVNAEILFSGGLVFTFELSDPVSFSDTDRVAVLWDDEVLAFGPNVVRQGSRVVVTLPAVQGQVATMWCTSLLTATVKDKQPLSRLNAVLEREATAEKGKQAEPNALQKFLDGYLKTTGAVGVVAALALGVGVFLWLRTTQHAE